MFLLINETSFLTLKSERYYITIHSGNSRSSRLRDKRVPKFNDKAVVTGQFGFDVAVNLLSETPPCQGFSLFFAFIFHLNGGLLG